MHMSDELIRKHEGHVTHLTLNRPQKANALSGALVEALLDAVEYACTDGTRLLILDGAGEHFCSGFDFSDFQASSDGDLALRLKAILDGLAEVIAEQRPAQVALEKVFVNVNPSSTLLLGQARGTAICAAVMHGLPVAEYTALQVKQAVVGNGHAQKRQVQDMVRRLLKLAGEPSTDAADALACAICHAHGGQGFGRLATAGYRMKKGRLV